MVYNFVKLCAKALIGCKIGDLLTTADLHQRLLKMGYTKSFTRANLLRNMENAGYIKMKGLGIFELMNIPEINRYEVIE